MTRAGSGALEASDEVLALRVRTDDSAFPELYRRYIDPVYRFMRYQAPTQEAQDLTAQVFLNAFRAAGQFHGSSGGSSYRAWIFRIAHNTLMSWRRGRARTPVPVPEMPEAADADRANDPEQRASDSELSRVLWDAVSELPDADRELIHLRYVEGLPHGEIATVTGGSDGAIRVRIHRLVRRLRASLERRGVKP